MAIDCSYQGPYTGFVDCTRQLAKAGTYTNKDATLSVRIMKKDTAWVMDGVYDGYGRDRHGPGGVGPVFHHGVKIHGNDKDLLVFEKYKLDSVALASACDPIHKASRCSSAIDIGEFFTPGECAKKAKVFGLCGDTFMFSKDYPVWGCKCCDINDSPLHNGEELWALYSVSNCTVKEV